MFLLPLVVSLFVAVSGQQPHIVFVFMDDLGWNDVGYHGSEIMTPHIDSLAAEGVKLERYFVQPVCSPSRSQLLTGRYQIHTCMSHRPVGTSNVGGLAVEEVTLPERLGDVGYRTHLVGKWHLGYSSLDYVPTGRGFDTFYGFYLSSGDHYEHTNGNGVDLHDDVGTDLSPVFTENGTYSTHLFTQRAVDIINQHDPQEPLFLDLSYQAPHTPLQAPQEYIDLYEDIIPNQNRKIFAGMITCVDDAIRNLTSALQDRGMWNNTVFIFSTDNGGGSGSSNLPLRADKGTYFYGGIQGAAFVSSPLLSVSEIEYTGLLHVSDWMPTLLNLAGGDFSDLELDGFDVWDAISENGLSPRSEVLHHINPDIELKGDNTFPEVFDVRVQASLTSQTWKIMTGFQEGETSEDNVLLFNVESDPTESTNVAQEYPEIVLEMLERLAVYNSTAVPPCQLRNDADGANPDNHGGAWMPWM